MAYTALEQALVTLGGVDGVNPFENAENPDVVNGNEFAHNTKVAMLIWNQHATEYVQATPKVQRSLTEGGEALTINDPTATQIDAGEVQFLGPFSSTNFRNNEGKFQVDWALEAGTIADTDVLVALVKLS